MRSYVNWLSSNAEVVILRVGCYIPLPTLLALFAHADLKREHNSLFRQRAQASKTNQKLFHFQILILIFNIINDFKLADDFDSYFTKVILLTPPRNEKMMMLLLRIVDLKYVDLQKIYVCL